MLDKTETAAAATPASVQLTKDDRPARRVVYLKIKIKSLAAEAAIIRHEEKRWPGPSATRTGLHLHRVFEVRREARAALLAYGFLRGCAFRKIEATSYQAPDWKRIEAIAAKYAETQSFLKENFAKWKAAADQTKS